MLCMYNHRTACGVHVDERDGGRELVYVFNHASSLSSFNPKPLCGYSAILNLDLPHFFV